MMRTLSIAGAVVVLSAVVMAQDAVKTLPDNYTVQFENEYVRVTRVHYGPHAKLPGHTHTSLASAYVYLNDSGPVSFKHIGLDYGAVTRPPTVARGFRLFRGLEEIHEVENLSDKPSDFLRVEFKTDPGPDPRTLRGKFLPPAAVADATQKLEFENAQLRVTRLAAPRGQTIDLAAHAWPSVVISLTDGEQGRALWLRKGQRHALSAGSAALVEALRFELKTEVKTSR
jgi:quercetin dioxygenase-like cupin family protein